MYIYIYIYISILYIVLHDQIYLYYCILFINNNCKDTLSLSEPKHSPTLPP